MNQIPGYWWGGGGTWRRSFLMFSYFNAPLLQIGFNCCLCLSVQFIGYIPLIRFFFFFQIYKANPIRPAEEIAS